MNVGVMARRKVPRDKSFTSCSALASGQLHQHATRAFDVGLPRVGRFHCPRCSVEQHNAERLFQLPDLLGQGRLGNMQRLGSAGKAAVVRDGQ
jgi:hypothetical protein